MSRSIDSVKHITIEGLEYPVKNITPTGDPLDQMCPKCGARNRFHIECEVSQLGFLGDVHIILCTCKVCDMLVGWRYFLKPDEVI